MADIAQVLVKAVRSVLIADTVLQTLTEVVPARVLRYEDRNLPAKLPVLLYAWIQPPTIVGGQHETREATLQLTAFAEGASAEDRATEIIGRVERGLTVPLLAAQGVDVTGLSFTRVTVPTERDGQRALARADVDVGFMLHSLPS